ncbi:MAG: sigma-70 family RNA polymerase sigma factor [Sedimentisphaerales bacterium]|nr:sigma-70 family RNA polymerase sigma factor [Sedimentisphaerales bacterium]
MDQEKNKELTVFWAQSQPTIASFIHSLVPNFQDADDILQNVAIITVEKFEQFDRNLSFTAWANGIARNLILKYYSQKGKKLVILDAETINKVAQVYEQESRSIHDQKESMQKALKKCLMQLKNKWKKIVDMHYIEEFSPVRIAQQLSMTRNNVFVSLHRIRLALKKCVERELDEVYS